MAGEQDETTGRGIVLTVLVGITNFISVPLMGALSDRVGRLPVLMVFSSLVGITAYPVMAWLVTNPRSGGTLTALMWMSFLYGGYQGAMVVTTTEIMPSRCMPPASRWLTVSLRRSSAGSPRRDLHLSGARRGKPGAAGPLARDRRGVLDRRRAALASERRPGGQACPSAGFA